MSRAARNRRSPCSVRMRPRAWRWNSGAFRSRSSAETCRLTADWLSPRSSPARVKLPASATLWKMRILSQSKTGLPAGRYSAASSMRLRLSRNRSASSAAMQPSPAAVTAWRYTSSATSPAAKTPGMLVAVEPGTVFR